MEDLNASRKRLDDIVLLGGREKVAGMLARFADHLEQLMRLPPNQAWPIADVHRLVGLAGILGFGQVERCWRAVEVEAPSLSDLALAREAADSAIKYARAWR